MRKGKNSGKITDVAQDLTFDPGYQALVDRLRNLLNGSDKANPMLDLPLGACVSRLREFFREQGNLKEPMKKGTKPSKEKKEVKV